MLEVLNDDVWEVWLVSQITSALNGAQRALVCSYRGLYQVPRQMRCECAFVRDPVAAGFISAASSFLFRDGDAVPMSPNSFLYCSHRLPSYSAAASANSSRLRARNSFEWAMIVDGGLLITDEDWGVNKVLSSLSAIEAMNIPALLERGFHLKLRKCLPGMPSFLRRVSGVPSSSAFPPLWYLRFFASRVYGRGGPDGSHPASAAEKRRLDTTVRAELVLCVALEIAAEREANQRTQVLPVELINLLLGYNRSDETLTHEGPLSLRAIAERLMRALSVDPKHHVTERTLHVRSFLYYVQDAVLDADESPVLAASPPVLEFAIPRRPPFADPAEPIRAIVVEGGSRAPAAPHRPLPLRSVAPPWSPSCTVPPPSTRPPAPAVPSGRPSRSGAPILSAPPLSDLDTAHADLVEFWGAYPYLRPILDRFGDQRTARLRRVLDCVSGWVRAADRHSVRASQRRSRGSSTRAGEAPQPSFIVLTKSWLRLTPGELLR